MPSFSKEVWVDIDVEMDEFDDDELIHEIESRGYKVLKKKDLATVSDIEEIAWLFSLNKTDDALIQLERLFPELKGMINKIKNAGVTQW